MASLLGYQQQPIAITQCFMGWTQSSQTISQTISQRSLKKNELIYFINYFFLKNLNGNLLMCLHLETNSSHVLSSDPGSAFMIASFSVKHRSHFGSTNCVWVGFASYRLLKVIMHAAIFQLPHIFPEFCTFSITFISKRSGISDLSTCAWYYKHSDKHFSGSGH